MNCSYCNKVISTYYKISSKLKHIDGLIFCRECYYQYYNHKDFIVKTEEPKYTKFNRFEIMDI